MPDPEHKKRRRLEAVPARPAIAGAAGLAATGLIVSIVGLLDTGGDQPVALVAYAVGALASLMTVGPLAIALDRRGAALAGMRVATIEVAEFEEALRRVPAQPSHLLFSYIDRAEEALAIARAAGATEEAALLARALARLSGHVERVRPEL